MSKSSHVIFSFKTKNSIVRFYFSHYKSEKDDPFISEIKKSIEIFYKKYFISDDIGISTIHMLQTIENKIKSLFNILEHMDPSHLIQAEKVFLSEK